MDSVGEFTTGHGEVVIGPEMRGIDGITPHPRVRSGTGFPPEPNSPTVSLREHKSCRTPNTLPAYQAPGVADDL